MIEENPILLADGVRKDFHHDGRVINVLKGIDLAVRRMEMIAIVGKSGVGKSTLLHILGTLDRPTSGKVVLKGKDVFAAGERELSILRNNTIGFVFQFHHLLPEFTALENTMLPAIIGGMGRTKALEAASALLIEMGLADRMNHRPFELSGGEQQRVAIARALVMKPDVIIADEPTGNLDQATSEEIHDILLKINSIHKTAIITATHNMNFASKMNRVLRLHDGILRDASD